MAGSKAIRSETAVRGRLESQAESSICHDCLATEGLPGEQMTRMALATGPPTVDGGAAADLLMLQATRRTKQAELGLLGVIRIAHSAPKGNAALLTNMGLQLLHLRPWPMAHGPRSTVHGPHGVSSKRVRGGCIGRRARVAREIPLLRGAHAGTYRWIS